MVSFKEWLFSSKAQRDAWAGKRGRPAPIGPGVVHLTGAVDCPVAGVSFRQDAVPSPGSYDFTLRAEPTNSHDRNAVKVLHGPRHVGYLPRDEAALYSPRLQAAYENGITVTVGGDVRPGSRIEDGDDAAWILLALPAPEDIPTH